MIIGRDGALITATSVECRYGDEVVLSDIDLAISAGDLVGIVGPNGSGKTTLLRALTGALRPTRGAIERSRGVSVGYVPQVETVNWFFPVTVKEAVLMGRRSARRVPWASPAEQAEAQALLARMGIDHLASRHIRQLSGGQQQRVFVARALLSRPQVLLLDEPTSGVDIKTRHDLMHLLHELHHEGLAIVFTTHDLNGVAAHLPELICLNRRVIARGPSREVLTPGVLERTYGAPMEVLLHAGLPVVVEAADQYIDEFSEEGEHHQHAS